MATIIIVDRVGKDTRILDMARNIGGEVLQMSASYWPKDVAISLNRTFGFEHELVHIGQENVEAFLRTKLNEVPLENFVKNLPLKDLPEAQPTLEGMSQDSDDDEYIS